MLGGNLPGTPSKNASDRRFLYLGQLIELCQKVGVYGGCDLGFHFGLSFHLAGLLWVSQFLTQSALQILHTFPRRK
jgi:hypothetical protein